MTAARVNQCPNCLRAWLTTSTSNTCPACPTEPLTAEELDQENP